MRILIVDDDETLRLSLRLGLEAEGFECAEAEDGLQALALLDEGTGFDVVMLDVNMPRCDGLSALEKIKEKNPQIFCIVVTAHSDIKSAVRAIKLGAYDYIEKPIDTTAILSLLHAAQKAKALVETAAFSAPMLQFDEGKTIIGSSSEIHKVFKIIYKLAHVDTPVLVRGASGTGKELVARALHFNSQRRKGPFVAVNCAAIPENLIESELFGYEKGAFTGAERRKIGTFQFAAGGTLFLDEIGDIAPAMQVKLLRVLQEKTFTPVGSCQELGANVRIVAATNRPLEKMIAEDKFRADLFYRLNVLPIFLPSLAERRADIKPLCEFLIAKYNKLHGRSLKKIDHEAFQILYTYDWPGNIRELENVMEYAVIFASNDIITIDALPHHLLAEVLKRTPREPSEHDDGEALSSTAFASVAVGASAEQDTSDLNFPHLKEQFERDFIVKALKHYKGRINQTAQHTQMTKVTLLRKLEKYGINPQEFR